MYLLGPKVLYERQYPARESRPTCSILQQQPTFQTKCPFHLSAVNTLLLLAQVKCLLTIARGSNSCYGVPLLGKACPGHPHRKSMLQPHMEQSSRISRLTTLVHAGPMVTIGKAQTSRGKSPTRSRRVDPTGPRESFSRPHCCSLLQHLGPAQHLLNFRSPPADSGNYYFLSDLVCPLKIHMKGYRITATIIPSPTPTKMGHSPTS
jgi:hypothetical protein